MTKNLPEPESLIDSHIRHALMASALASQRKRLLETAYLDSVVDAEYCIYKYLISKNLSSSESIFEVISDGFDSVAEPEWHGLMTAPNRTSIDLIGDDQLNELRRNISQGRKNKISGLFRSHLEIGTQLSESVLFKIHGDEVKWLNKYRWDDIHSPSFPLREHALKDSELAPQLENCMRAISQNVLWPQFFAAQTDYMKCFSIVHIMTTSWAYNHGVWAVHGMTDDEELYVGEADPQTNLKLFQLISPAFQSIVDAARVVLEIDSLWPRRRQSFVRFCKCIGQPPNAVEGGIKSGESLDKGVIAAAEKLSHLHTSLTLPNSLRIVFDLAVNYLGDFVDEIDDGNGSLKDGHDDNTKLLYNALKYYFVGLNLEDLTIRSLCIDKATEMVVQLLREPLNASDFLTTVDDILKNSKHQFSPVGKLGCEKAYKVVVNFRNEAI